MPTQIPCGGQAASAITRRMDKTPRPGGGWPIREEPLVKPMHLRLTERSQAHVSRMASFWLITRPEAVRRIIEEHMSTWNKKEPR